MSTETNLQLAHETIFTEKLMRARKNIHHQYTGITQYFANLVGYDSWDDVLGTTIFEIKSPNIENAHLYHEQDKVILNSRETAYFFNIQRFANSIIRCTLNRKSPIFNDGAEAIGIDNCFIDFHTAQLSMPPFFKNVLNFASNKKNQQTSCDFTFRFIEGYKNLGLTDSESNVLFLIAYGKSMKSVAFNLSKSIRTIESHLSNIKSKLGVNTREQLIEFCMFQRISESLPYGVFGSRKAVKAYFDH